MEAFCHAPDPNWLDVLCELPVLASSFVNTRFRPAPGAAAAATAHWTPRDEPPFLDTDLARATVLLTHADYAFFCAEHGIALPAPRAGTRAPAFVVVQLVELGGDHIDLMMRAAADVPPALREVVARSHALLRTVAHVVYFANAAALPAPPAVAALQRKLAFVARVLRDSPGRVLFAVARTTAGGNNDVDDDDDAAAVARFVRVLETELPREAAALRWCRADCFAVHHLTPRGTLDSAGIVATLARLLRLAPVGTCAPPSAEAPKGEEQEEEQQQDDATAMAALVAPHVLAAARACTGQWLTAAMMRAEAEELAHGSGSGSGTDCPAPVVVQQFAPVCRALAARHALLLHRGASHGDITVTLVHAHGTLHWQPRASSSTTSSGDDVVAVRLPVLAALREGVASLVARDVPAALWFATLDDAATRPARAAVLEAPLAEGRRVAADTLAALARALAPACGVDDAGVRAVWDAAATALEDCALAWAFAHGTDAPPLEWAAGGDAALARLAAVVGLVAEEPAHRSQYRAVVRLL